MLDKKYKAIYLDLISRKENGLKMEFSLSDNQTSDFILILQEMDLRLI